LSAVVVLLAVLFWGWLWGIGGAIIGVPLTVVLLLFLQEFEATHPIAVLLSDLSDLDEG
jgi:AI-2 transport protein TqsA